MNLPVNIHPYIWIGAILLGLFFLLVMWLRFFFGDKNQRTIVQNKVKRYFGFLFDYGFKIDETDVNGPNGAWVIVLKTEKCKIRIIQDRNDIFCELMPHRAYHNKYHDLPSILASIEKKGKPLYYSQTKRTVDLQLEYYGHLLQSNFDKVIPLMENHNDPFTAII